MLSAKLHVWPQLRKQRSNTDLITCPSSTMTKGPTSTRCTYLFYVEVGYPLKEAISKINVRSKTYKKGTIEGACDCKQIFWRIKMPPGDAAPATPTAWDRFLHLPWAGNVSPRLPPILNPWSTEHLSETINYSYPICSCYQDLWTSQKEPGQFVLVLGSSSAKQMTFLWASNGWLGMRIHICKEKSQENMEISPFSLKCKIRCIITGKFTRPTASIWMSSTTETKMAPLLSSRKKSL